MCPLSADDLYNKGIKLKFINGFGIKEWVITENDSIFLEKKLINNTGVIQRCTTKHE